ncbi:HAD family hydrolase [Pseudomonas poae]|nr:HAD family hydrolase [Pseudomonas poae]
MVEGVIFDAFGTLLEIRNRQNPYRRLLRLGSQQGRAASPNDIRWIMTHHHGLEDTAAAFGIKISPAQFASLQAALELELQSIRVFDDTWPAINLLRSHGIKIGVCSNLSGPYCSRVRELLPGLDGYALSADCGAMKPDQAIYQSILGMLSLGPGDLPDSERSVVMIGDSKKCDEQGPRASGILGYHLDRSGLGRFRDLLELSRLITAQC